MRLNKYVALATGMSRRAADTAIEAGRVGINGKPAKVGQAVEEADQVSLDNRVITPPVNTTLVMLNKPVGYVCSRDGQGNKTVYDLLPENLHHLKPVGRLDKDSSGLILLTDDGQFAYEMTHPKFEKIKKYKIALNNDLAHADFDKITKSGVTLDDGLSKFSLDSINSQPKEWKVEMREGRNRQIRRTFEALGYNVVKLHRTHLGPYELRTLTPGKFDKIKI